MKLKDLIAKAVDDNDATAAGQVADYCRFKLGMNYGRILALVKKVRPTVEEPDWDYLLFQADTDQSNE